MLVNVEIGFDQLVSIVKKLPANEWAKLKTEVDRKKVSDTAVYDTEMEAFLLNAPTFTDDQLEAIAQSRKAINQWHKKQ